MSKKSQALEQVDYSEQGRGMYIHVHDKRVKSRSEIPRDYLELVKIGLAVWSNHHTQHVEFNWPKDEELSHKVSMRVRGWVDSEVVTITINDLLNKLMKKGLQPEFCDSPQHLKGSVTLSQ